MARRRRNSSRLDGAATDVGRALGNVAARVDALRRQRAVVAAEIHAVINAAQRMLADIGDDAAIAKHRGRKALRQAGAKRKISPAGRARIIAALRKRWAKYHAEQKAAGKG